MAEALAVVVTGVLLVVVYTAGYVNGAKHMDREVRKMLDRLEREQK